MTLRCPSFARCLLNICCEPGFVPGSGDSRINQTWSLPMSLHKPVGQRGFSTDNCETLWEGLLEPWRCRPNSSQVSWGGVSSTGAATLVLGLGESVDICQMEEILASPLKA